MVGILYLQRLFRGNNGCADTNYLFVYVDIGSYVTECGSAVFKRSTLWTSIQTNMLEWTGERPFAGTEGPNCHTFYRRWGNCAKQKYTWTFYGSNLNVKKSVYNYRLCRAQSYKECAFGVMSNKWRYFKGPFNFSPDIAVVRTVLFCTVLFAREMVVICSFLGNFPASEF